MKNAFITGAAVGQGNLLVKYLAQQGWRVFGGVLPGATTDLSSGGNITLVETDVSSTDSVNRAAQTVQAALKGEGLHLLMNVAGVADFATGTIECMPMDQAKRMFEINTWGQLRVVQAFLPMVRAAGRGAQIFNYGSGAILVNPPIAGAYNMSKHAVHGMTLTLRHELAAFGITATTIMPGGVKTGMTENAHARTKVSWGQMPAEMQRVYGPSLEATMTKVLPDLLVANGSTPEAITTEVSKLIGRSSLKPFYLVGGDARPMGPMRALLSETLFEKIIRKIYKIPAA